MISGGQGREVHSAAAARLGDVGQRYTSGRRALVHALTMFTGPVTVDTIRSWQPLALSSLYRNLTVLEEAGVVRRVATHDEAPRYELNEDLTEHHHHLVCTSCGLVEDFVFPPALERAVAKAGAAAGRAMDFDTAEHHLELIGLCRGCRAG
ncbi:MAG: Fur family transcriptional regulator, ferric uptake regulator [Acidimicrobiaceae bacterium]|nr:Fur family transcriptional regulator, ferric uptake regulator [Acidimicrobiaceae bacterium]